MFYSEDAVMIYIEKYPGQIAPIPQPATCCLRNNKITTFDVLYLIAVAMVVGDRKPSLRHART